MRSKLILIDIFPGISRNRKDFKACKKIYQLTFYILYIFKNIFFM